jgi:hypothetical protein
MRQRFLASTALLLGLLSTIGAQTRIIGVDEIKPGMTGVGRTIFAGDTLEEFKVHILGVLRNVVAPKRDLVLARLEGGPLAKTGVIAGMSGSPVYIDGRLLGAVSYALGQFATEPIAGITPIGEMTDATAMPARTPGARPAAVGWPTTPRELVEIWSRDLGRAAPFVENAGQALVVSGSSEVSQRLGAMLRPIAVPLVAGGFEASVLDPLSGAFSASGFVPVSSSRAQQQGDAGRPRPRRLGPGDAVGVSLLTGDFELGATGTVTHVDGDRVYAFGHPLYNLGPTEFPMTSATIVTVLPSLLQSSKLASFGDVIGTLQQDRATAVAGKLGPGPSLIPMTITLNSDRGPSRNFSFGIVRDFTFTPLLSYLAVANVLTSYERGVGPASFAIKGTATIESAGDISFEDIFTGDQPAGGAAAYVAAPLTALLKNASDVVNVEKINLTIDAAEQPRSARIERVWLDTIRPRAGGAATVSIALRSTRGESIVKHLPISLPANVSGPLQLIVADAARTGADDRRDTRSVEAPPASQIIRNFNRARRNNRIYVRLTTSEQGAVVSGEPMPALPPSVLSVLESDRSSGSVGQLRTVTRGEWEVAVDLAVSGSRQLTITLDQN